MEKIDAIRHSLAHLLAAAVLEEFPNAKLGIGPTIENGFYYDFLLPRPLTPEDLIKFEKRIKDFIKQELTVKGKKVTAVQAKKEFKNQPFKLELIKEFAKGKKQLTIYSTGDVFSDLCRGGHVKNIKEINFDAFKLTKIAGAYWRGDEKNPQLQRIYGVAFSDKKGLEDYIKLQEEIEKRDHRRLGQQLDLFHFEDIAPGAVFWHGKGMIIWRELEKFMRAKLDRENYQEISTPIMIKKEVFEKSGHWQHYRQNMFYFALPSEASGEGRDKSDIFVLKPMNCPESTYIYSHQLRSYKDLPMRLSEITDRLHRNELSGTLGGLFRVRQMSQDDAHIYCRPDQIESEIKTLIDLVKEVYGNFDLPLSFSLATKPEKAMGEPKLWKKAEQALENVLKNSKIKYQLRAGDGAFYGPKIDINAKDSLGREWTIATVQLDFQMPERFDLNYIDEKGEKQRPVMIHRAILGTFERFIGILIEHYAGALPFWLSPTQIKIVPVADRHLGYAEKIAKQLKDYRIEIATEKETVGKKIRNAEMQKIPYTIVVGDEEEKNSTISVRQRGKKELAQLKAGEFTPDTK
ncbi:MAG: threonine--tRNA ligase, partial [Patescibacteria group bacterium]